MPPKPATAPKPTEATPAPAPDAFEDDDRIAAAHRKRDEALAKAALADPVSAMRKRVESDIAYSRNEIANLNADLRVARLKLKAEEACLLALGPVPVVDDAPAAKKPAPKPAASLKAAVRRTGQKHVE